jgi:predicted DNA-binding transcriptional regulator AlpA
MRKPRKKRREPKLLTYRSLEHIKPPKFQNHLTLTEVARLVGKDKSWIRTLEAEGRIPTAARVKLGQLQIRLWSPAQVEEIKQIFREMRVGRPPNA